MLKLIVMLVCDSCIESFEPVAVSCDRDPRAWCFLTAELEARAEASGWNLFGATHRLMNDHKHICPNCLSALGEFHEAQDLQSN